MAIQPSPEYTLKTCPVDLRHMLPSKAWFQSEPMNSAHPGDQPEMDLTTDTHWTVYLTHTHQSG